MKFCHLISLSLHAASLIRKCGICMGSAWRLEMHSDPAAGASLSSGDASTEFLSTASSIFKLTSIHKWLVFFNVCISGREWHKQRHFVSQCALGCYQIPHSKRSRRAHKVFQKRRLQNIHTTQKAIAALDALCVACNLLLRAQSGLEPKISIHNARAATRE